MLREQCGYQGQLAYWDWTLDWENITTSPIWDTDTGFGGDGNSSVSSAVFNAYCVTEGPFAHLEVPYYEHIYQPHCLLRGFDEHLEDFRDQLKPEALEKLLLSADYDTINLGLENGPHVAIPKSINGDFSLHTAPSGNKFCRAAYETTAYPLHRSSILPPSYAARSHVVALAADGPEYKVYRIYWNSKDQLDGCSDLTRSHAHGKPSTYHSSVQYNEHRIGSAVLYLLAQSTYLVLLSLPH